MQLAYTWTHRTPRYNSAIELTPVPRGNTEFRGPTRSSPTTSQGNIESAESFTKCHSQLFATSLSCRSLMAASKPGSKPKKSDDDRTSPPPCNAQSVDLGESVSIDEKSEKFCLFRYGSAQSGFTMRVSDSSMGGDADQLAKIEGDNRALIVAEGEQKP